MRRVSIPLLTAATVLTLATAPAVDTPATDPIQDAADEVDDTTCDDLDPTLCLLPFPNDLFTETDESTPTGLRVDLEAVAMPRAGGAKPIDPAEWNRNDGFSPGSPVLTFVPGLDLARTWKEQTDGRDVIQVPSASLHRDAPMVIVDATTGRRHPFIAELDQHPDTADDERTLILRPLRNFEEGHRYVVGLRSLRDSSGEIIPARESFAAYRDGEAEGPRAEHMEEILHVLEEAEVGRRKLYLAWDFTVASGDNLAGRVLHMRDESFAALGDDDLADGQVAGDAPSFAVESVESSDRDDTAWLVHGTVTTPNYLQLPQERTPEASDPTGAVTDDRAPPLMVPGSRLYYGPATTAAYEAGAPPPMATPEVNPAAPTMETKFLCRVPASAVGEDGSVDPATPALLGHGLLGQRQEVTWSSGHLMTEHHNTMYCGAEWLGMAFEDLPNVATILLDLSQFPSLADRAQQGFLGFLLLGRAMAHPEGFASHEAFQHESSPVFDPAGLVYDGNSQGGIMGGALTAIAPDFSRAVLGVPGMNYSTLLNRSVDWEGEYGEVTYASYPDKREQQLAIALIQMLWDRAEANGYAAHMTDDPYDNTPVHQVLMHVAFGDYQVANLAAEVQGRTIGAAVLPGNLADARHWAEDPAFGFDTFRDTTSGSALIYWDSGNPTPPNANVPPEDLGQDPHGDPRSEPDGGIQKARFFDTGDIIDVRDGSPYWTDDCRGLEEIRTDCP